MKSKVMTGKVIYWKDTYGFIMGKNEVRYFAHFSQIQNMDNCYKKLEEGQNCEFDIERSEKGLAAINIYVKEGN